MLKVKFIEKDRPEFGYYGIVNGIKDQKSFISENVRGYATFIDANVIEILLDSTFEDIGKYFSRVSVGKAVDWWNEELTVEIYSSKGRKKAPSIRIILNINSENWARPYSINDLSIELKNCIKPLNRQYMVYFRDQDFMGTSFGISCGVDNKLAVINQKLIPILENLRELISQASKNLLKQINEESILTFFDFPTEIKTACKQYLIYFTQFLLDIGIDADSEIKEEANKTLFKIIPKNKEESLDKIKDALAIYLNTASMDSFEQELQSSNDVAVLQWQSNIMHLKSQLLLANSMLQMKDATIEALQLSNYQYKANEEKNSGSDEEEVIKGIVSVKKYNSKGISINFAEILRRLKRKFK